MLYVYVHVFINYIPHRVHKSWIINGKEYTKCMRRWMAYLGVCVLMMVLLPFRQYGKFDNLKRKTHSNDFECDIAYDNVYKLTNYIPLGMAMLFACFVCGAVAFDYQCRSVSPQVLFFSFSFFDYVDVLMC